MPESAQLRDFFAFLHRHHIPFSMIANMQAIANRSDETDYTIMRFFSRHAFYIRPEERATRMLALASIVPG